MVLHAQNPGDVCGWSVAGSSGVRMRFHCLPDGGWTADVPDGIGGWREVARGTYGDYVRILGYPPNRRYAWALSNRGRDRAALVRLDLHNGGEDLLHDTRRSTSTAAGSAMRAQLLKEAVPHVRRFSLLWNGDYNPGNAAALTATQAAAGALGMDFQPLAIRGPDDLQSTFATVITGRAAALLVAPDPVTYSLRSSIIRFAAVNRLPVMYNLGKKWRPAASWRMGRSIGTSSARRDLRRQDPQGRQARRPARRAAHQVRAGHQPQDREGPRPHDPAVGAGAGG